jgi:ribonuclease T1
VAFTGRLVEGRSFGKLGLATALIVGACVPVLAQSLNNPPANSLANGPGNARDLAPTYVERQGAHPNAKASSVDGQAIVSYGMLPTEAQATTQLIRRGGPFPYRQDGVSFGNRERFLPVKQRGYYREYTVPTPRARNRGAQRIVCGGRQPTSPEACYYTNDHYASFKLIVQ